MGLLSKQVKIIPGTVRLCINQAFVTVSLFYLENQQHEIKKGFKPDLLSAVLLNTGSTEREFCEEGGNNP